MTKSKKPKEKELHKRVGELEKGHSKVTNLKDELRIISMEYADIKYRIEATDVLIDHILHELEKDIRLRRRNNILLMLVLILALIGVLTTLIGF
jgi:hypothetical protein